MSRYIFDDWFFEGWFVGPRRRKQMNSLLYFPTIVAYLVKYGPTVASLINEYGPGVENLAKAIYPVIKPVLANNSFEDNFHAALDELGHPALSIDHFDAVQDRMTEIGA